MPRNGTGGYSLPNNSWNPAINGAAATAADWQTLINDVATAVQQSVSSDGQTTMTGSLQMGGFVVTGLGAPSGADQSLRWEQLAKGSDIASAATIAIPNEGALFDVTGTTTITAMSGAFPGRIVYLRFKAALTLTNSASLVMPNGADLKPYPNEIYAFCNSEPGIWTCVGSPPRLPALYRSAGNISASGSTVTISPGSWRSLGDTTNIFLISSISKVIQSSGAWAAGGGGNGLFSGAKANSTWYHVFAIRNDSTGAVDAGFDTSLTAANRPAGWNAFRRVGSVFVTASGNILGFRQAGSTFWYQSPISDLVNSGLGNLLQISVALTVPLGVRVTANFIASVLPPSAATIGVGFSLPGDSSSTNSILATNGNGGVVEISRLTNTSRQIGIQANNNTFASGLYLFTTGYTDFLDD